MNEGSALSDHRRSDMGVEDYVRSGGTKIRASGAVLTDLGKENDPEAIAPTTDA